MDTRQSLYPLKFAPIYKEAIWGGTRIEKVFGKKTRLKTCAESWELSCVPENVSMIRNGFLEGNDLKELIETYQGDLLGDSIYDQFGTEFPILVKFIDAHDDLSIQVHPDDRLATERHGAKGKTEMWYVMEAGKDSSLIAGFNQKMNREKFLQTFKANKLKDVMNFEKVTQGDVFFIPSGRVHAIGKDILLAEIQQTSNITYRIYDWERVGSDGKPREMHTELALDAIDYNLYDNYKTHYQKPVQGAVELVQCPYFTANLIQVEQPVERDYHDLDSFVIYICTSGSGVIQWDTVEHMRFCKGDVILIPAILEIIGILPAEPSEILEVYIQ